MGLFIRWHYLSRFVTRRCKMGESSEGMHYKNVDDMWTHELGRTGEKRDQWYRRAEDYWNNQEVSVNGVLGGYEHTSSVDLEASRHLLEYVMDKKRKTGEICNWKTALDGGAGIGRITKGLLCNMFETIDMVEPCEKYCNAAREYVGSDKLRTIYCEPLQEFTPEEGRTYDVFWIQWVLLYLPDDDLIALLQRCKASLNEGGVICIKENVVFDGGFHVDKDDNSIMRTHEHYQSLIRKAGLTIIGEMRQPKFPSSLFPVMMYAAH